MRRDAIYKGRHEGWYSVADETFYTSREVQPAVDGVGSVRGDVISIQDT